jgi:hypothetical protein
MYRYSEQSKGFGDVLTDAFVMGADLFKPLLPMVAVYSAGSYGIQMLMLETGIESAASLGDAGAEGIAVTVLGIVFAFTFIIGIFRLAHGRASGSPTDETTAIVYGLRKSPVAIVAMIGFVIFYVLGLVLLVIPGLIVLLSMSLFLVVIATEGVGLGSLKRSHDLIWGHWWWTFGLYLLWGLVALFLGYFLMLILEQFGLSTIISFFENLTLGQPPDPKLMQDMYLAGAVISVLFTPFQVALQLVILNELKLRKGPKDDIDSFKGLAA